MGFCFFGINYSFLPVHVAGGDNADQRSLSAKREYHMQHAAVGGLPQCMKTGFRLAVTRIWNSEQRITKKHGLRFRLRNVMLLNALSSISFIPIKSLNPIQHDHLCILS
jgi:hypothetical protein